MYCTVALSVIGANTGGYTQLSILECFLGCCYWAGNPIKAAVYASVLATALMQIHSLSKDMAEDDSMLVTG